MPDTQQAKSRAPVAAWGQWLVIVALSMVVGALSMQLLSTPAADGSVTTGGSGKVFAIAGQISGDSYGVYLVDLEKSTICLYEYVARDRRLWLRAARTFHSDVQLDSYNTMPSPDEIKKMATEARRGKNVNNP